jgi:hypothetical protein
VGWAAQFAMAGVVDWGFLRVQPEQDLIAGPRVRDDLLLYEVGVVARQLPVASVGSEAATEEGGARCV